MFLDASAIVAIIAQEKDWPALSARLEQASRIFTSPIAIYEAIAGLSRIGRTSVPAAQGLLEDLLEGARVEIIPITPDIGLRAIDAFTRFGKGRHPAGLNMGDCFAYACARELNAPLLCKGNDFSKTDIALA